MTKKRLFRGLLCLFWLSQANAAPPHLIDYGDPAAIGLKQAFAPLRKEPGARPIHIVQFGDSHTAADYFTGRLRQRLQAIYGTGSVGWLPPLRPAAQRSALVAYESNGWTLIDSRRDDAPDFPMGGYIAQPADSGRITYSLKSLPEPSFAAASPMLFKFLLKREYADRNAPLASGADGSVENLEVPADGRWHVALSVLPPPVTLHADGPGQYAVGGVWLLDKAGGVSLSAIGGNGAQQSVWNKWRPDWIRAELAVDKPDLLILAYGTNEAFNPQFDAAALETALTEGIRQLRRNFPRAAVLLIGAPDSLRKRDPGRTNSPRCHGQRPASLDAVQALQRQIARAEHTLYWDWQAAMGGPCSMRRWQTQGLARPDGVHFSATGYEQAADTLADDLLKWLRILCPPHHFDAGCHKADEKQTIFDR